MTVLTNDEAQNEIKENEIKEKPGYKTSEFWLTFLAMILGVLMASGAIGPDNIVSEIAGMAVLALSKLGYTASRANVKGAASLERASAKK